MTVRKGRNASAASWPIPTTGIPDDGDGGEGVLHADWPIVEGVIVGHVDHVHAGGLEGDERLGGRAKVVGLAGHGRAPLGDRRLEIDHGQIGTGQHRRDRRQHVRRVGPQLVGQHGNPGVVGSAFGVPPVDEMGVAGEGKGHRLATTEWTPGFDGG